jgi:hypothetical protein
VVPGSVKAVRALAPPVLAAAFALGGCGGGSSGSTAAAGARGGGAPASGNPTLGNPRLVDCRDWRRGDPTARNGTIRELHAFAGGPVGGDYSGATIPDGTAYRVMAGWCRQSYATYFKLYKLYTRAAAFASQSQQG